MIVTTPVVTTEPDGSATVRATIGTFDLWYRVPRELTPSLGGEFLACAALLPAMTEGGTLELPDACSVDVELLRHLDELQEVFLGWQAFLGLTLHRVEVQAAVRQTAVKARPGALCFFSGGVDGSFTALRHREQITTTVLLRGIDMQLTNESLWDAAVKAAEKLATHWSLPLRCIETNVRFLGYHYGLRWSRHYQGAGLASVAHLVPHTEVLVAASHDIATLEPNGSHALTDPLWSSSTTKIVHDGAVARTTKIEQLGADPQVLEVLRVCWHDSGFNCGACEKCVRTMVALRLLGLEAPTFPADWNPSQLDVLRTDRGGREDYVEELRALELRYPDPVIRRALNRVHRTEVLRNAVRTVDRAAGRPVASLRQWLRHRRPQPGQPAEQASAVAAPSGNGVSGPAAPLARR